MSNGFLVLVFLACCLLLFIDYLIAREFYRVAEEKGCAQKKYLWITFFFWIVGMLLVVALPDRKQQINTPQVSKDELPDL